MSPRIFKFLMKGGCRRDLTQVPEPACLVLILRNEWANMVNKECFKMDASFSNFLDDDMAWKTAVSAYT